MSAWTSPQGSGSEICVKTGQIPCLFVCLSVVPCFPRIGGITWRETSLFSFGAFPWHFLKKKSKEKTIQVQIASVRWTEIGPRRQWLPHDSNHVIGVHLCIAFGVVFLLHISAVRNEKPLDKKNGAHASGPLNRLNAILSLLHPLDRYRTPAAIFFDIFRFFRGLFCRPPKRPFLRLLFVRFRARRLL